MAFWPFNRSKKAEPVKRRRPTLRRKFEAAKVNRLNADAPVSSEHINSELRTAAPILIARARWLHQNDGYIRRGLNLLANNIIGSRGIQLKPMVLTQNGTNPDKQLNDALTVAHKAWGKKGVFNRSGRYSWRSFQKFTLVSKFRDGESFIFIEQGLPTALNPFGFWLKLIDPLRIPFDLNRKAANGNNIVCGIEFADDETVTAYYVQVKERGIADEHYYGRNFQRVDAARIIHDFDPEMPEQVRGYSGMVGAMRVAPMLDGYNEAALIAARNGASTMGWYEQDIDAIEEYDGDDEEDDDGDLVEEIEPGVMRKLPPGIKANMHNPAWPNTSHSDFVKSVLRHIASDMGVSYNAIANDLEGVNLSSMRHGVQEDREQYKQHQADQVETVHDPIYRGWLVAAMGTNQIIPQSKPISFSEANYQRLLQVAHMPRGWEFAEPLKDAQSNLLNLKMRLTSPSEIIRKTGRDPDDVFTELADDIKKLDALGLDFKLEDLQVVVAADETSTNDEK